MAIHKLVLIYVAVPSAPPQGVQVLAMSSRSITVEWFPPHFEKLHGILQGYKIVLNPMSDKDNDDGIEVMFCRSIW